MSKTNKTMPGQLEPVVIKGIDFLNISEKKAERCVTHHYACDCREFEHATMNTALKVIHIWATFEIENGNENPFHVLKQIANKSAKALKRDDLIIR